MQPEDLAKLKKQFPETAGVKFVLVPYLLFELKRIEESWHNSGDISDMEVKAVEKRLLLRIARDLGIELQQDIPSGDSGIRTADSGITESV